MKKKLKNKKKPPKKVFLLKKTQLVTDFQYLSRFRDIWSLEKYFFKPKFPKIIFGLFRAIWIFFISVKNGADHDFLYFFSIDGIS